MYWSSPICDNGTRRAPIENISSGTAVTTPESASNTRSELLPCTKALWPEATRYTRKPSAKGTNSSV